MKKHLQDITNIQFGVAAKTSNKGNIICIQVKNITQKGSLNLDTLLFIDASYVSESDFLQAGDILLPAKGSKLSAVIISEDEAFMTVASSSLFIIRINSNEILPGYLQWFLNLSHTQWQLEKEASGTNISSLSIKYLRKFPVTIPDLATQKKIIRLGQLQKRESEIMSDLKNKRKSLMEAVTKKLIT